MSFGVLLSCTISSNAQVVKKVKRKGVQPVNVTRPPVNGSTYSLEQFNGKWQEISRRDRTNDSGVDFDDTLYFIFSGNNDLYTRNGVNLSLKGKADLEPGNVLTTGADEYIIRSLDTKKAVLDDGEKYIHILVKKEIFSYELLPTDSIAPEKFTSPVQVNHSDIIGKWTVYRREAKPGGAVHEPLLKTLTIENKSDNEPNGKITFYLPDKSETVPCRVTLQGTKIHIISSKRSWSMDVYKADKKEFIFGGPGLMYYCKPM